MMKLDSYTKTLLALMVVSLLVLYVVQMRLADAARRAANLVEAEREERKGLEREAAQEVARLKEPNPAGFTAAPFATM